MAKISTYGVVSSPALLTDLVIGTDVSANNETKNFELGQILSLYPSTTQKASISSTSNQTAVVNTNTTVSFNSTEILSSGLTRLPSTGAITSITVANGGYYSINFIAGLYSSVSTTNDITFWLEVYNGGTLTSTAAPYFLNSVTIGYRPIAMSWIINFQAGDQIFVKWKTTSANVSLGAVSAIGIGTSRSASLFISQV